MTDEKKIWFPAKTYGWGWGPPVCWQGWVVLVVFIVLILVLPTLIPSEYYTASVIVLSVVLTGICVWKGEKPRWRWGRK